MGVNEQVQKFESGVGTDLCTWSKISAKSCLEATFHLAMAMSPSAVMSASPSKKRKHTDNASLPEGASRKKVKKEKKEKSKKRDKGKAKDVDSSEFKLVNASLVVSIPPVFANDPMSGVEEMLDSLVMRYVYLL